MCQQSEAECPSCTTGALSCPNHHPICNSCSFSGCRTCERQKAISCQCCLQLIHARFVHNESCASFYCLSCWREKINNIGSKTTILMFCGCQVPLALISGFLSKHCYDCEEKLMKRCRRLKSGHYVNEKCLNEKMKNEELEIAMKAQLVPICSKCDRELTGEESRILQVEDYLTCKNCNEERIMKESCSRQAACPDCGIYSKLIQLAFQLPHCIFCSQKHFKKCVRCENIVSATSKEVVCNQCLAELLKKSVTNGVDQRKTPKQEAPTQKEVRLQTNTVYKKWQAVGQALRLNTLLKINLQEIVEGRKIWTELTEPEIIRSEIRPKESYLEVEKRWQVVVKVVPERNLQRCQFCLILIESELKQRKEDKDYRICLRCAIVRVGQYRNED